MIDTRPNADRNPGLYTILRRLMQIPDSGDQTLINYASCMIDLNEYLKRNGEELTKNPGVREALDSITKTAISASRYVFLEAPFDQDTISTVLEQLHSMVDILKKMKCINESTEFKADSLFANVSSIGSIRKDNVSVNQFNYTLWMKVEMGRGTRTLVKGRFSMKGNRSHN